MYFAACLATFPEDRYYSLAIMPVEATRTWILEMSSGLGGRTNEAQHYPEPLCKTLFLLHVLLEAKETS